MDGVFMSNLSARGMLFMALRKTKKSLVAYFLLALRHQASIIALQLTHTHTQSAHQIYQNCHTTYFHARLEGRIVVLRKRCAIQQNRSASRLPIFSESTMPTYPLPTAHSYCAQTMAN